MQKKLLDELEDLLKQQQWKQADEETVRVMLQAANRTKEELLWIEDIDNFPCEDLRTIDQLWVKYSNGKFGFSVQAKIYHDLGGTQEYNEEIWNAFGDKVGWRQSIYLMKRWIYYKDVTFDLKVPQGHLPCRFLVVRGLIGLAMVGWGWNGERWGGLRVSSLASRLVKCNI